MPDTISSTTRGGTFGQAAPGASADGRPGANGGAGGGSSDACGGATPVRKTRSSARRSRDDAQGSRCRPPTTARLPACLRVPRPGLKGAPGLHCARAGQSDPRQHLAPGERFRTVAFAQPVARGGPDLPKHGPTFSCGMPVAVTDCRMRRFQAAARDTLSRAQGTRELFPADGAGFSARAGGHADTDRSSRMRATRPLSKTMAVPMVRTTHPMKHRTIDASQSEKRPLMAAEWGASGS